MKSTSISLFFWFCRPLRLMGLTISSFDVLIILIFLTGLLRFMTLIYMNLLSGFKRGATIISSGRVYKAETQSLLSTLKRINKTAAKITSSTMSPVWPVWMVICSINKSNTVRRIKDTSTIVSLLWDRRPRYFIDAKISCLIFSTQSTLNIQMIYHLKRYRNIAHKYVKSMIFWRKIHSYFYLHFKFFFSDKVIWRRPICATD